MDDHDAPGRNARAFLLDAAGWFSVGAGLVHAGAVGIHAEHPATARVFVVLALLQTGSGILLLVRRGALAAHAVCLAVNIASVVGWVLSRTVGIGWIDGLGTPENPQVADSLCALLAAAAAVALGLVMSGRFRPARVPGPGLVVTSVLILTVPAMWTGASHVHAHDDAPRESALEIAPDGVIVTRTTVAGTSTSLATDPTAPGAVQPRTSRSTSPTVASTRPTPTIGPTTTVAQVTHTHSTTPEQRLAAQSGWPRAFDPASGPDFDGVAGVTEVQFQRARAIIIATTTDLAKYASVSAAEADGYRSIGDGVTGYEHWVKWSLIQDGRVLDSTAPESLVYRVENSVRTLVSAMYMAQPGTDINDSTLTTYAGPLMQWHVHNNLCFLNGRVVGLTNAAGECLIGARNAVASPMVHVWVVAHPCGPFAAVEGVAAGTAQASDEERLDLCSRH